MYTFLIGLAVLLVGGFLYANVLQKIFKTNGKNKTIAFAKRDNVDYAPMGKWRNAFVQFKSIAATGPILGPIQGIIFGPIVFLTIPIGNILGGLVHDTYSGLISMRNGGAQVPEMIRRFLGKVTYIILFVLIVVLSLLVGAVFITMPAKLIIGQIEHAPTDISMASNWVLWVVIILIFAYYVVATVFPIHKIIGKVYPTLSVILLSGTIILFVGACTHQTKYMPNIWDVDYTSLAQGGIGLINPGAGHYVPLIFVTITCGMVSGFHSTQSTIVGRAVKNEKDSKLAFSYPMIIEGVITMIWAFIALTMFNGYGSESYNATETNYAAWTSDPTLMIGSAAHTLLWGQDWLAIFIILVVCMEAITVGDTSLRSCRLICAEHFKVEQKLMKKRLIVAVPIFVITGGLMFFGLFFPSGFNYLWRYFAWTDQTTVALTFAFIIIYMMRKREFFYIALIPGAFYAFVSVCFIVGSNKQGINAFVPEVDQWIGWIVAYVLGGLTAGGYIAGLLVYGFKSRNKPGVFIEEPQIQIDIQPNN